MKICLLTGTFPPDIGGIQTFTYELGMHLSEDERISKVSVISRTEDSHGEEWVNPKYQIVRLPRTFLKREILPMFKLINRRDYDVFHATDLPLFVASASLLFDKKFLLTVYGSELIMGNKNPILKIKNGLTFENVDRILGFSDFTCELTEKIYDIDKSKMMTLYPGVETPVVGESETESLRKDLGIEKDDFVILSICRLVERKGLDDLLRAAAETDPSVKVVLVGGGPMRKELYELSRDLGIKERVIFVGEVPYTDVFPYYRVSDVFCMPSKFKFDKASSVEGLGLVYIEAQNYGLPCIGTKEMGIPEAIENGKTGFLVESGAPSKIAKSIEKLKQNEKLYDRMSKKAEEFSHRKFNWNRCIDEHIKLYKGD